MDHVLKCHDIVKTDFVRAENCYLYDSAGKRYVDFESGIWSTALGHNHPRINQAIRSQIEQVIHLGTRYPNRLAEEAAMDVLGVVGIEDGKCVFLSSGSEAVECAVQIARRTTGKSLCLTFSNSYLAAFGSAGTKDADHWQLVDGSACADTDVSEYLATIPFDRVAAFVFEPGGSGSGFVKFPPEQLVQAIVHQTQQAGGAIVANEVTTGMGRTGKWFGFEHYDLQPDIVALGKGLGNGYPVSAVAMKLGIARRLEQDGFRYAQSHQNDPLGCAVAREVIATMRQGGWVEMGAALGVFFLEGLRRLAMNHRAVKEARGRGMLLGLELHSDGGVAVETVYQRLLESGFLVGYYPVGHILRFDPALTIAREDINQLLASLDAILSSEESGVRT